MKYVVIVEEYYNQEFDFWLYENDVVTADDIEPDLIANLVVSGVIEAVPTDSD